MSNINLVLVNELCKHYKIESSFFSELHEIGLIEIIISNDSLFIHEDKVSVVDKIIRIHHDLDLNIEAIDTIFNLLKKIDFLQRELDTTKNRLRLYEEI